MSLSLFLLILMYVLENNTLKTVIIFSPSKIITLILFFSASDDCHAVAPKALDHNWSSSSE